MIDQLQNQEINEKHKKERENKDLEDNRLFKTEICHSIQNHSLSKSNIDFTINSENGNNVNNTELQKFEDSVYQGGVLNRSINNLLNEINKNEEQFDREGDRESVRSLIVDKDVEINNGDDNRDNNQDNRGSTGNKDLNKNSQSQDYNKDKSKDITPKKEKKDDIYKQQQQKKGSQFIKKNEYKPNTKSETVIEHNLKDMKDIKDLKAKQTELKPNSKKILQITKNKPSNLINNVKRDRERERGNQLHLQNQNINNIDGTGKEILKTDGDSAERVDPQKKNSKSSFNDKKKMEQQTQAKTKKALIISHKGALSMPKLSEIDPGIFQNYNINTCPNESPVNNINFYTNINNINTVNANNMNLQNNVIAKNVYIINNASDYSPIPRKIFEMTPRKYQTNEYKKKFCPESKHERETSKSRIDKNLSNKFIKPNKREESMKLLKSNNSKQFGDEGQFGKARGNMINSGGDNTTNTTNNVAINMNNISSQKKLFSLNANKRVSLIAKDVKALSSLKYKEVFDNSHNDPINTSIGMKPNKKNSKLVSFVFN